MLLRISVCESLHALFSGNCNCWPRQHRRPFQYLRSNHSLEHPESKLMDRGLNPEFSVVDVQSLTMLLMFCPSYLFEIGMLPLHHSMSHSGNHHRWRSGRSYVRAKVFFKDHPVNPALCGPLCIALPGGFWSQLPCCFQNPYPISSKVQIFVEGSLWRSSPPGISGRLGRVFFPTELCQSKSETTATIQIFVPLRSLLCKAWGTYESTKCCRQNITI